MLRTNLGQNRTIIMLAQRLQSSPRQSLTQIGCGAKMLTYKSWKSDEYNVWLSKEAKLSGEVTCTDVVLTYIWPDTTVRVLVKLTLWLFAPVLMLVGGFSRWF
jgi:hypothetical protein